jgi:hypothetical protein
MLFAAAHEFARRASTKENLAAVHEKRKPVLLTLEISDGASRYPPFLCEFVAGQNVIIGVALQKKIGRNPRGRRFISERAHAAAWKFLVGGRKPWHSSHAVSCAQGTYMSAGKFVERPKGPISFEEMYQLLLKRQNEGQETVRSDEEWELWGYGPDVEGATVRRRKADFNEWLKREHGLEWDSTHHSRLYDAGTKD